uniref:Uncharacterized protein n=1 Tax=Romanomermis culicivorax TaxID=13658 RepID=A0A915L7R5_ROMCU
MHGLTPDRGIAIGLCGVDLLAKVYGEEFLSMVVVVQIGTLVRSNCRRDFSTRPSSKDGFSEGNE